MKVLPISAIRSGRGPGTFVKICGICNLDDARACADAGADAIGFLLEKPASQKSPDSERLSVAEAKTLVDSVPTHLISTLLIHSVDVNVITDLCEKVRPRALQIQESVEPESLLVVRARFPEVYLLKTFRVAPGSTIQSVLDGIQRYTCCGSVDGIVLDSARGGSGQTHDWTLSSEIIRQIGNFPVILAGGLTVANVAEALRRVRPWGVDVMSGVNSSRRNKKDADKVRLFVQAAREHYERAESHE